MPFNGVTYRINRDTKRMKAEMQRARTAKANGESREMVMYHVRQARRWWSFVKMERRLRDAK